MFEERFLADKPIIRKEDEDKYFAWLEYNSNPIEPRKPGKPFIDRSDGYRFWSKYFRFGHSQKLNDYWVSVGQKGRFHFYYRKANNE